MNYLMSSGLKVSLNLISEDRIDFQITGFPSGGIFVGQGSILVSDSSPRGTMHINSAWLADAPQPTAEEEALADTTIDDVLRSVMNAKTWITIASSNAPTAEARHGDIIGQMMPRN